MSITKTSTRYVSTISVASSSSSPVPIYSFSSIGATRSRTGSANPNWRQQVARHQNASTGFSASEQTLEFVPTSQRCEGVSYDPVQHDVFVAYYGNCKNGSNNPLGSGEIAWVDQATLDKANNQAITALYKKVRSIHSQAAGGVILGEFHKTMQMIVRPALTLRKSVSSWVNQWERKVAAVKAFDKRGARRNIRARREVQHAMAGSYLEATFGWQPLLTDVKDAAVALARLGHDLTSERFRAIGTADRLVSMDSFDGFEGENLKYRYQTVKKARAQVIYYGAFLDSAIDYARSPSLQRVIDLSGFNLREMLPTLWELTPWSFFADYFINIGDLLMAASTDTSKVAWLTKVIIKSVTERRDHIPLVSSTCSFYKPFWVGPHGYGSPGRSVRTYRTIDRTAQPGMPMLAFQASLPGFWSKHMLNTGALLAGGAFSPRWR